MPTTPFAYRSLSFHESWPRPELVALGARLGFNDCTFQTEKGTMPRLRELRRLDAAHGLFALARRHGMTVSVWTHELGEPEPAWGPVAADNPRLWRGLAARYDHVLGELLPGIDHLVLTVVEAQVDVASDAALLVRTVETVAEACRRHGVRLVLRSFVHHPDQHEAVAAVLRALPAEVAVMTKCVPQDWHLRHGHDPLIGAVGGRTQIVECDIAGEYWQEDRLANAFTHILAPQLEHWRASGARGISVRVDRGWRPWERQATVLGNAQEANLWLLGMLASGAAADEDACWAAFAEERFGAAAPAMVRALRPSGRVVEEACHVDREAFGLLRLSVPVQEVFEGGPSWERHLLDRGLRARPRAAAYEDADDAMYRNPFNHYGSVHRWAPAYRATYRRLRRGDPALRAAKAAALDAARATADACLAALEDAAPRLDRAAATWHRWHLAENRVHLDAMGAMQLAWLDAERALYCGDAAEAADCRVRVESGLAELARIHAMRADETLRCTWDHRHQERRRLEQVDLMGFVRGFRRYFALG